jgi:nucleotide-binding universal stress UspA family protein
MELARILVALKPWERTLPLAANHARQLAQRSGAQLRLLTTVFDAAVAAACERGDTAALASRQRALAAARVELERLARTLRSDTRRVTTASAWGIPAYEAIAAATREWPADLLVVAAHEPQSRRARLTDTDWQLMRRTSCPLLLVKSLAFEGYEQIVARVDAANALATSDEAVLTAGRCFARTFGSHLSVVDAVVRGELGRAAQRSACLFVVRAPTSAATGAELDAAAEDIVNAAPCDVLIVPAAVREQAAAAECLEVG